ncbi:hypothetical protein KY331_00920 [Candidatus Woesearchaeota archaeon]|nr:hypothetical protein [Candidatus Woesearchaeota archaeon]
MPEGSKETVKLLLLEKCCSDDYEVLNEEMRIRTDLSLHSSAVAYFTDSNLEIIASGKAPDELNFPSESDDEKKYLTRLDVSKTDNSQIRIDHPYPNEERSTDVTEGSIVFETHWTRKRGIGVEQQKKVYYVAAIDELTTEEYGKFRRKLMNDEYDTLESRRTEIISRFDDLAKKPGFEYLARNRDHIIGCFNSSIWGSTRISEGDDPGRVSINPLIYEKLKKAHTKPIIEIIDESTSWLAPDFLDSYEEFCEDVLQYLKTNEITENMKSYMEKAAAEKKAEKAEREVEEIHGEIEVAEKASSRKMLKYSAIAGVAAALLGIGAYVLFSWYTPEPKPENVPTQMNQEAQE